MKFGGEFKPPETLKQQAAKVTETLKDGPLIPPSVGEDAILQLSSNELKERFPKRYELYLDILRKQKNKRDILPEDIEKYQSILKILNGIDTYLELKHQSILRGKQVDVMEDLQENLEQGKLHGYIVLPTGVGKTVLFSEVSRAAGVKTLVLVPSVQLVHQTTEEFGKRIKRKDIGKFYQKRKELESQYVVATYQSFLSRMKSQPDAFNAFDLVILDEAHEALSVKRQNALNQILEDKVVIGLTATDEYSETKKVGNLLPYEFHRMRLVEAIELGLLSDTSVYIAQTDYDLSRVDLDPNNGELDKEKLNAVIGLARAQAAIEVYKKLFSGERVLVNCINVEHAATVKDTFLKAGILADTVSFQRSDNQKVLEEFKKNSFHVLAYADYLKRGYDSPFLNATLNLRPVASQVYATQRNGRVTRIDENNPNKEAVVVEFLDQRYPPRFVPVLMTDILGGLATVTQRNKNKKSQLTLEGGEGYAPEAESEPAHSPGEQSVDLSDINLKVYVDPTEVLKVASKIPRPEKQIGFPDKETFLNLVVGKFKTNDDYRENYIIVGNQLGVRLPGNPLEAYPGLKWSQITGTISDVERSSLFPAKDVFMSLVREYKANSQNYLDLVDTIEKEKNITLPRDPHNAYPGFSWSEVTGFKQRQGVEFASYDTFLEILKKENITTSSEYEKRIQDLEKKYDIALPTNPRKKYDKESWAEIFGRESRNIRLENYATAEQTLDIWRKEKILSTDDYRKRRKSLEEKYGLSLYDYPPKVFPEIEWAKETEANRGENYPKSKEELILILKKYMEETGNKVTSKTYRIYYPEVEKHSGYDLKAEPRRMFPDFSWKDLA